MQRNWEHHSPQDDGPEALSRFRRGARSRAVWLLAAGLGGLAVLGLLHVVRPPGRSDLAPRGDAASAPGVGPRLEPLAPPAQDQFVRSQGAFAARGSAEQGSSAGLRAPAGGGLLQSEKPGGSKKPAEKGQGLDSPESLKAEAIEVASRLVEDFPDRPEPVALLAITHRRLGNSAEAIKCWQRCLELDPGFAAAYEGLGAIALLKGDCEAGVAHFRRGLAVAPSLPSIRTGLAEALMGLGKADEARSILEEAVLSKDGGQPPQNASESPQDARALFLLGKAYLQLKEYEKAKVQLEAAVKLDPSNADAYYGLTTVCTRLGEKAKAAAYRAEFEKRRALNPQSLAERRDALFRPERLPQAVAAVRLAAGNTYAREGNAQRAEECWLRAASLRPDDATSRHQLALLYLRQNRLAEALEFFGQLRQIDPQNVVHCLNQGFVQAQLGRLDAAEETFEAACRIDPKSSAGYAALGRLRLQTGRFQEARQMAQKAVELEPTAANYALLGSACGAAGEVAAARAAFEQACRLEPGNAEYQRMYAQMQSRP